MSAPQTYGASLYDLAKDEGMSREILVDLEGIVSLFNEHPAYVKILDAPQIERDDLMEILNEDFLGKVNRYVLNFLKVVLKMHVDKKCIGGIIIETDGMWIDSSIKSGLEDLKKALI